MLTCLCDYKLGSQDFLMLLPITFSFTVLQLRLKCCNINGKYRSVYVCLLARTFTYTKILAICNLYMKLCLSCFFLFLGCVCVCVFLVVVFFLFVCLFVVVFLGEGGGVGSLLYIIYFHLRLLKSYQS